MRRPFRSILLATTPALIIGAALHADDPAGGGDPTQITPAAREVIDRAHGAMGGAGLFDAVQSVSYDCTMASAQGTMLMTVRARTGSGTILEQSLAPPGGGDAVNRRVLSTNASGGWARDVDSGGVRVMPVGVTSSIARAGDQWNFIRNATGQFRLVEHAGSAQFAGRACAKLRCTDPRSPGLEELTLFFDDETGLPLGQETATSSGSLISGIARIDEWQTINGMMIPKIILVEGQTGQSTLTFTRVEFNGVPASDFETPEDVVPMLASGSN